MIEVEASEHIPRRSPEDVFAFIANFENNPRWQKGMQFARFTSEGPLAVGSTYDQVAHFLGKEIRTSFKVTELMPDAHITIESTSGPFPIKVRRSVAGEGEGTRVWARVTGDATGFFRLWSPLLRWMVQRSVRADYRRLRVLLA